MDNTLIERRQSERNISKHCQEKPVWHMQTLQACTALLFAVLYNNG